MIFLPNWARSRISLLAETDALGGYSQSGAVHKGHHIFYKAQTGISHEFGLGVLEHQLAGRGAVDAEFMLDVANVHSAVALVVDEHRKAASVGSAFFGTGKHQMHVGIAVGDEPLHTVQPPATFCLIVSGFQHHALKVGSCIGFGEVHAHGFACADAGDILLPLLLATELIEGVGAGLKAPDILEAGICGGHYLVQHRKCYVRKVEAAVAPCLCNSAEACLAHSLHVLYGLGCIYHAAVFEMRAFQVHRFGVGREHVRSQVSHYLKHALVVLYAVLEVLRGIVEFILVLVEMLAQFHDPLHQGMTEVEFQFGMVGIVVCHS